jgi:undecaprenyl-diphosphatase
MVIFSTLGNMGAVWILVALIFLAMKRYRACGIVILMGMTIGLIVGNGVIKNLIARQRPSWINEQIVLLVKNPWDYSFPSGHTMHSVIAATIIYRGNRKMGIAAYALASIIAFSRLYLYVHYPTDILGGILIGVIIAISVIAIYDKLMCRKWESLPKLPDWSEKK